MFQSTESKTLDKSDSLSIHDSEDMADVGEPNQNAQGIDNDAFCEHEVDDSPAVDPENDRKASIEVVQVESDNIQPSILRMLVEPNSDQDSNAPSVQARTDADNNETVDHEETGDVTLPVETDQEAADPFDTSSFDAKAFDAFNTRFESDSGSTTAVAVDPFASPFKTATNKDSNLNEFDTSFSEPFLPKQPDNTPFKKPNKKKKDSFEDSDFSDDDDDEQDNLRIVIKAKMKDTDGTDVKSLGKLLFQVKLVFSIFCFQQLHLHCSHRLPNRQNTNH